MKSFNLCFVLLMFLITVLFITCKKNDGNSSTTPPKLILSDSILDFDSTKIQKSLTISNAGSGTIDWSITIGNISWISAIPISGHAGSAGQLVLIQIDRVTMPKGHNSQDIYVTTTTQGNKKLTIKAYKTVPAKLVLSDSILDFDSTQTEKSITLSNAGDGLINWSTNTGNIPWITITPFSGQVDSSGQMVLFHVNRDTMPFGQNNQEILINTTNMGSKKVTVKVFKPNPPKLVLSDSILDFDSTKIQKTLIISNGGSGLINWTINIGNIPWISAIPSYGTTGSTGQIVLIQIDRETMPFGQNNQDIYVTTPNQGFKKVTVKAFKSDIVKDFDGNPYTIIKIGDQEWLKENLKTKHAPDGTSINYLYPNNEPNNFNSFGLLYTWDVAGNGNNNTINQGICPNGWRVPNDNDWYILITFAGGMDAAGGALKETGTLRWQSPNVGATNSTGYTLVGAGDHGYTGQWLWFMTGALLWSATSDMYSSDEMYWSFRSSDITAYTTKCNPGNSLSVRCIKE